jgi:hypothetical protein
MYADTEASVRVGACAPLAYECGGRTEWEYVHPEVRCGALREKKSHSNPHSHWLLVPV